MLTSRLNSPQSNSRCSSVFTWSTTNVSMFVSLALLAPTGRPSLRGAGLWGRDGLWLGQGLQVGTLKCQLSRWVTFSRSLFVNCCLCSSGKSKINDHKWIIIITRNNNNNINLNKRWIKMQWPNDQSQTIGSNPCWLPLKACTFPLSRDVAHISTCDDGCLALADLLGWKVGDRRIEFYFVYIYTPLPGTARPRGSATVPRYQFSFGY